VAKRAAVASRPLVGRAGEIDAVVNLLQGAVNGDGGALLISGEAGVGKTALVGPRDRPATAHQRPESAASTASRLAWDEAYAWWRAAEALAKDRAARDAVTSALRRAHELAMDLQAAPLLREVEALAQSARISLATIDVSEPESEALPDLTPREREVLAHIVAGRTYGEIARELVLSEKTVSVHVSHLLHKTGTANRIELAQLARRVHV
jgi:DNA-binding CsgD family transcriptional regulator